MAIDPENPCLADLVAEMNETMATLPLTVQMDIALGILERLTRQHKALQKELDAKPPEG
jgi:hypothetical protein